MEIKLTLKGKNYSVCIGKKTAWFSQMYWITIARIDYDDRMQVVYGDLIYHS